MPHLLKNILQLIIIFQVDNKFAILPKDLKELTNFNNDYSLMLSSENKDLQENEMDIYNNYRVMGIVDKFKIEKSEAII